MNGCLSSFTGDMYSTLVYKVGHATERSSGWTIKTTASKPLGVLINVSGWAGYSPEYYVSTKSSGLSCDYAEDKDD